MVEDSGVRIQVVLRYQVSGFRCQGKKQKSCNLSKISSAAKLQRGTLKPPSKPCNSGLALGTRFSRFQFFVIGVCVLHLTQLEVIIAVSQDIS